MRTIIWLVMLAFAHRVEGQPAPVAPGVAPPSAAPSAPLDPNAPAAPRAAETLPAPATVPQASAGPSYLGVRLLDAPAIGSGAYVRAVVVGSPADRGGVLGGDTITSLQGQPIRGPRDVAAWLERTPGGTPLAVVVRREGRELTLNVTVEARTSAPAPAPAPPSPASPPRSPGLGVHVGDVPVQYSRLWRAPDPPGAHVLYVVPGSPAMLAGIPVGAVITMFDGRLVQTSGDLRQAVSTTPIGKPVEVVFLFRGIPQRRTVTLAQAPPPLPNPAPHVGPPTPQPAITPQPAPR